MPGRYLGLRGNALLRAAVMLVVCPTFTCYGYNMSVAGGLLTLESFNTQFPRMQTINVPDDVKAGNSLIQGPSIDVESTFTMTVSNPDIPQVPSSLYILSEVSSALYRVSIWVICGADARSSSSPTSLLSSAQSSWHPRSNSPNSSLQDWFSV